MTLLHMSQTRKTMVPLFFKSKFGPFPVNDTINLHYTSTW